MPSQQGERLREFLAAKGMTQAELARRLGVSPAYVNDVITGRKNVTLNFANRLSPEIDLSPYWLIWGAGPMGAREADERLGVQDGPPQTPTGEGLAAEDGPAWGRGGHVPGGGPCGGGA